MAKSYRSRPGYIPNESLEDWLARKHREARIRLSKSLPNQEWSSTLGWQESYDIDDDISREAVLLRSEEGLTWHMNRRIGFKPNKIEAILEIEDRDS